MKNRSLENEVSRNVGSSKKSTVVGKGFVNVSSRQSVSIVPKCFIFIVFFTILNSCLSTFTGKTGYASVSSEKYQNLGKYNKVCSSDLGKFKSSWQYYYSENVNKNKTKKFLEINNLVYYKSRLKYKRSKKRKRSKTNWRLILSGDIELNPGPPGRGHNEQNDVTGKILTYNVRGMKEYAKAKRIFNTCAKIVRENRNAFINLQETHLDTSDLRRVEALWRGGFNLSPGTNRQRGCITLWDLSWDVIDKQSDNQGRFSATTLKKGECVITIMNVYAPNDHELDYFNKIFEKLIELRDKYDSIILLAGDFNLIIEEGLDSLNRNSSRQEIITVEYLKDSARALQLFDCYRNQFMTGGYTWNRGKCYSRLDMVFASDVLEQNIVSADIDWAFDQSDHAKLEIVFRLPGIRARGPGLPRINVELLEKEHIMVELENRLGELIVGCQPGWDPHMKWEFVKMGIRSIMWEIASREKKIENQETKALNEQINALKDGKAILSQKGELTSDIENQLNLDLTELEDQLKTYLSNKSKSLAHRAKTTWFNEGEKSNKYFLNLIKKRRVECEINSLESGGTTARGQKQLETLVKDFYEQLYKANEDLKVNYDSFFPDCHRLSGEDQEMVDKPVTLEELELTLRTCKDSSPGPDGIPYSIYGKLWKTICKPMIESWEHSKTTGLLPTSQRHSSITLLPKEGKDLNKIGNWRPITLTNCDIKIFTKLYSNRLSKVMNKIIHPSQTAYIPGRVVHDNLRMFDFFKEYCNAYNVNAVLMSMDARKAFDSVDHKYMHECLKHYGFTDNFISIVKLFYRDIKADILINGYKTAMIKIERSVKQGDALSCALFILCIDPLIRRIENNPAIAPVEIRTPLSNYRIQSKCGAFADDVGAVIMNERTSIENVLKEYEVFSSYSGININEDKTEIMPLNNRIQKSDIRLEYSGKQLLLEMVDSIKICGITFTNSKELGYKKNVLDKIELLKSKLASWQFRGLSLSGKLLVAKTFGLSQLIYTMQVCEYYKRDIRDVEAYIFKFLWSRNMTVVSAPDRIKRELMKQEYSNGGLKAPDIEDLDSALKLKQFLRATKANHVIKLIQKWQLENLRYVYVVNQEYYRLCKLDNVIKVGQITLNRITDKMRIRNMDEDTPKYVADLLAGTDVREFLLRKGELLVNCLYEPLFQLGIENLKQLMNEANFPRSDRIGQCAKNTLAKFPDNWLIAITEMEGDPGVDIRSNLALRYNQPTNILKVTVKSVRKCILKSPSCNPFTFEHKLGINRLPDINPFVTNRISNISEKMRIIKFRLLHCDIFSKERMFRFKMVECPNCKFCGEIETIKHQLWDCQRAKVIWEFINTLIRQCSLGQEISFESLFTGFTQINTTKEAIMTRIIQMLLQIDRSGNVDTRYIKTEINFLAAMYIKQNKIIHNMNEWNKLREECRE